MKVKQRKTILLVEDETLIALDKQQELEKYGYNVLTVNTGEKAVEIAKENEDIELILMDIDLGKGIDGTEVSEIILKDRGIPIVFLSSHMEPEVVEKTEKITSYGYVVKSSSITVLDASIKMAFKLFQANIQIEESDKKQKAMMSDITDVIGIIGADGIMKYKSPNIEKRFGWLPEEIIGTDGFENIHPDDIERIKTDFANLLKEDNLTKKVEYRYKCKDGCYKPIELIAMNLTKDPLINGVLLNYRDITDRKLAEEALRESEERLNRAEKVGRIGNWEYDVINNNIIWSDQAYDLYERDPELGPPTTDEENKYYSDEVNNRLKGYAQQVIETGEPLRDYEFQVKLVNGRIRIFIGAMIPLIDKNGRITKLYGIFQDITERKQSEEALRKSEDLLNSIVDNIPDMIFVKDAKELHYVRYNKAQAEFVGYSKEEAIGKNDYDLFPKDLANFFTGKDREVLNAGTLLDIPEETIHTKDGAERILHTKKVPIFDGQGNPQYLLGISEDITERKRAEEESDLSKKELLFLNSIAFKLVQLTYSERIEKFLPKQIMAYSDAEIAVFSLYDPEKHVLITKHIEVDQYILKKIVEIGGDKILETETPVSAEVYAMMVDTIIGIRSTLTEVTFGAIPVSISKAIQVITGIDRFYAIAHVIDGDLFGTTVLGFKKGKSAPREDLLKSFTSLATVSLKRMRVEKELIASEERLSLAMRAGNMGIWDFDVVNNKLTWDDQQFSLYGVKKESFGGAYETWKECVHPEDVQQADAEIQMALCGKKEYDTDFRVVWPDGAIHIIHALAKVHFGDAGQPLRMIGTNFDITERKLADEALRESEERFRLLAEHSADMISHLSPDGIYLYVSPAWERILGYSSEELVGHSGFEFIHPDDIPNMEQVQKTILEQQAVSTAIYRIYRKDGQVVWLETTIHTIRDPQTEEIIEVHLSSRDITERKQVEEALRQSEDRFRRLTENASDMIYRMSLPDGNYEYVSPASTEIFGYTPEEFLNSPLLIKEIIHPDWHDYFKEQWDLLLNGEFSPSYEYQIVHGKSGETRWLNQRNVLVQNKEGLTIAIEGIVTDITERKIADEKIKNLLLEKELILKEVHHRVKNNMNVMGSLLRLQSNTQVTPETKVVLQDAAGRLNSMMVLYEKLYHSENFGKLSLKEYVPSLIEEIVSIFPRSVKIESHIEDILIDVKLLSSLGIILNELITNSMKHAFNNSDSGLITVSASKKVNMVTVMYGDNGFGLPKSVTFENSTGFGMHLIGILVQQINGTIRIDRNNGARFIIEFEV